MGWSGVQVTTLPPKWVQSTDLLGKDNLGRKVRGDKVTELARTAFSGLFIAARLDHFLAVKSSNSLMKLQYPGAQGLRGGGAQRTGTSTPTKHDQLPRAQTSSLGARAMADLCSALRGDGAPQHTASYFLLNVPCT